MAELEMVGTDLRCKPSAVSACVASFVASASHLLNDM